MSFINKILSLAVIGTLIILISACSKEIEPETSAEQAPDKKSQVEQRVAKTYPEDLIGSVEDLYGSSADAEYSEAYREAVEQIPELRYNVVYFEFNSADISDDGKEVLRTHAGYLAEEPDVIVILEGHADKRGSEGYNIALSERRAKAVSSFLSAYGVSPSQLTTLGFGEEKPAVFGDTEEAYAKNRRVEIIYQ